MAALSTVGLAQVSVGTVRQIEVTSGWGGLGTPKRVGVNIQISGGRYLRDGEPIEPALVDAFVAALQTPAIRRPQMENLGITAEWLLANRTSAEHSLMGSWAEAAPRQKALFSASFSDPHTMALVTSSLFAYRICFYGIS